MSTNLEGKIVLVTGASSGIGREICIHLARAGCFIIAAARRTDRLHSLCLEINAADSATSLPRSVAVQPDVSAPPRSVAVQPDVSAPPRSVAVQLDVSASEAEIQAAVQTAWAAYGQIDALVNNAGIRGGVHSVLDWSEQEWNEIVRTNLTGLWLVTKHVCTLMITSKLDGCVVNISSIAGINRGLLPRALPYNASKSAVNFLTKAMALELGEYNIRVNAVAPGIFKSEITASLMEKEWFQKVTRKIAPLMTRGTPDPALTSLVRYLIDDTSAYVTGNIFIVDAGASLAGVPLYSSL